MVAATGVLVAAAYYVMNMRVMQRNSKQTLDTRQAQLLMNLYQRWSEYEFQEAWNTIIALEYRDWSDFNSKFGPNNPEIWKKVNIVGSFFEGLGVFVMRGFIDPTLVEDLMSAYVVVFWQKLGPMFIDIRVNMNRPTMAEGMEYLYNVIYEIWKKQHPETPRPMAQ